MAANLYVKNSKLSLVKSIVYKFVIDSEGSYRFNFILTHPTESTRVNYLQELPGLEVGDGSS